MDDVAHAPADLGPTHARDDAERAGVVAADLDGDPGRVVDLTAGRERRRVRLVLLEDLDQRLAGAARLGQERGRVGEVVGAEHDIHMTGPFDHEVAVLLGQTAADRDLEVGAAVLERLEVTQRAVEAVVGVLADAAGVEHHHVGGLEVVGGLHAVGGEQTRDAFRVVLVHLAPEGADEEAPGRGVGHGA